MKVKSYPKNKRITLTGKARKELAEKVWNRDNYTCQCPYCTGESMIDSYPHHIIRRSRHGSDALENLITLCMSCHADVHAERVYIEVDGEGVIKFIKRD